MYSNFHMYPSLWYKRRYPQSHKNTFTTTETSLYLNKFFLNKKGFHLAMKEISNLKSLCKLFLIKVTADISDSSFVLDSLLKTRVFPNFSAGNTFLFVKRFGDVKLSDRWYFIVSSLAWKSQYSYFQFFCFTAWK